MDRLRQLYYPPTTYSQYEQFQRQATLNKIVYTTLFMSAPLACIDFLFGSFLAPFWLPGQLFSWCPLA
jgi:hypothetical protein